LPHLYGDGLREGVNTCQPGPD